MEEEMLQRLANFALGVNTGNGNDDGESLETINTSNNITDVMGKTIHRWKNSIVDFFLD